jgi:predicted double-glycine peptidase
MTINSKFLPIKPYRQTPGYCGPASLKMVLDYYDVRVTEKKLAQLAGHTKTHGVTDQDIKRVAEHFGFKVEIKNNCTFSDIKKYLKKGVPPIVDWFSGSPVDCTDQDIADGHYSAVVGLDQKYIYLQDPELARIRCLKRKDFFRVWFDFDDQYLKNKKDLILRQIIAIYK